MLEDCLNENYSNRRSPHALDIKHSIQRVAHLSQTFPSWSQTHKHWTLLLSQLERSLTSQVLINGWRYWNQIVSMHIEDYRQVSRLTVLKITIGSLWKEQRKTGLPSNTTNGTFSFLRNRTAGKKLPFLFLCTSSNIFVCNGKALHSSWLKFLISISCLSA